MTNSRTPYVGTYARALALKRLAEKYPRVYEGLYREARQELIATGKYRVSRAVQSQIDAATLETIRSDRENV